MRRVVAEIKPQTDGYLHHLYVGSKQNTEWSGTLTKEDTEQKEDGK